MGIIGNMCKEKQAGHSSRLCSGLKTGIKEIQLYSRVYIINPKNLI